jgi:hypothetical protein
MAAAFTATLTPHRIDTSSSRGARSPSNTRTTTNTSTCPATTTASPTLTASLGTLTGL